MVFPWFPPLGVPHVVLKRIRAQLFEKLWRLVQDGLYPKSAQSSPTLSVRSLPAGIKVDSDLALSKMMTIRG